MIVLFNQPSAFILEVEKDRTFLIAEKRSVRLCKQYRASGIAHHIQALYVVATYRNEHGELVRLTAYCGDCWGKDFPDTAKAEAMAQEVAAGISTGLKDLGVEEREGTHIEPEELRPK